MKEEIPCIFYLYLASKLKEITKGYSTTKQLKELLFHWRVPRPMRCLIIRELELLNLIKIDNDIVKFKDTYFSEEKLSKYYQKLKIF